MGITITSLLLSSKSSLIPISDPDTLPPFLSLSQQHGCQKDMVHVSTILHNYYSISFWKTTTACLSAPWYYICLNLYIPKDFHFLIFRHVVWALCSYLLSACSRSWVLQSCPWNSNPVTSAMPVFRIWVPFRSEFFRPFFCYCLRMLQNCKHH